MSGQPSREARVVSMPLDGVATAPPVRGLAEAMAPWLGAKHANPASPHRPGREAAGALEAARAWVAALLGVEPSCVIFTSGATEANNLALKGLARLAKAAGREAIAVACHEHPSLLHPARSLQREGWRLALLPAGRDGRIVPESLEGIERLGLVAFAQAHAELGALQPAAELAARARARGARVLVDATLTVGRIPVRWAELGSPDAVTVSFHHFGGPAGVGALVLGEPEIPLLPLIEGGTQERGYRPGMPNVAGCVGAGFAAQLALRELPQRELRLRRWSLDLREALAEQERLQWSGPAPEGRLPGHDAVVVRGVDGEALRAALELEGFLLATASPCADEAGLPPAALLAAGYSPEEARGALVSCLPPTVEPSRERLLALARSIEREVARLASLAAGLAPSRR